ncbi:hypothetical protein ACFX11_026193 [Malus domestica]
MEVLRAVGDYGSACYPYTAAAAAATANLYSRRKLITTLIIHIYSGYGAPAPPCVYGCGYDDGESYIEQSDYGQAHAGSSYAIDALASIFNST